MPVLNPRPRIDTAKDQLAAMAAGLQESARQRGVYLQVGEEHENSILPQSVPEVLSWRNSGLNYVLTFYGPLLKDPDFDVGGFFLAAYNQALGRYRSPHISLEANTQPEAYATAIAEMKAAQRDRVQARLGEFPENVADASFSEVMLLAEVILQRMRFENEMQQVRALDDAVQSGMENADRIRALLTGDMSRGQNLYTPMVELLLDAYEIMDGVDMAGRDTDLTPTGRGAYEGHPRAERFEAILEHVPFHHRVIDAKLGSPDHPKLMEVFINDDPESAKAFVRDWLLEPRLNMEERRTRFGLLGSSASFENIQELQDLIDRTDGHRMLELVEELFVDVLAAKMADRFTLADMLQQRATTAHRITTSREEMMDAMDTRDALPFDPSHIYGMDLPALIALYEQTVPAFADALNLPIDLVANPDALDVFNHAMHLSRAYAARDPEATLAAYVEDQLVDNTLEPIRDIQLDAYTQWGSVEMAQWERYQHKPAIFRLPSKNVWNHPQGFADAASAIQKAIDGLAPDEQRAIWNALTDEVVRFKDVRRLLYGESADEKGPKLGKVEEMLTRYGVTVNKDLQGSLRHYVVHQAYTARDLLAWRLQEEAEVAYDVIKEAYLDLFADDPAMLAKLPKHAVNNVQPEGTGRDGGMIEMVMEILPPEIARLMERVKRMALSGQWDDQLVVHGPNGEPVDVMPKLHKKMQLLADEFPEQTINLYTCGQVYASGTHAHLGPVYRNNAGEYRTNPMVTPAYEADGKPQKTSEEADKQFLSDFGQYYALSLSKLGPDMRASMGNNVDDLVRNSVGLAAPKYFELLNIERNDPEYYALVRMGSSMPFVQFEDTPQNGHLEDRAPGASSDPRLRNSYHLLALQHATDNYIVDQLAEWKNGAITEENLVEVAIEYLDAHRDKLPDDPTMQQLVLQAEAQQDETLLRIADHLEHGLLVAGEFPAIQEAFQAHSPRGYREDGGGAKLMWWFDVANGAEMGERGPRIVPQHEREILVEALLDPTPDHLLAAQAVIEGRFADFAKVMNDHAAYKHRAMGQQRSDVTLTDVTFAQDLNAATYVQGVAS
jgi:hypothetical protein